MRSLAWSLALFAAVTAALGWLFHDDLAAARARARTPRLVFVTFDTLNLRYTGLWGERGDLTPNLDRLGAEGVVFDHAYTTVPTTLASHTSLFSGLSPEATGVLINGEPIPEELRMMAEILERRGYDTAAFVSLGVLMGRFGLDQGFDTYDDQALGSVSGRWYRYADEVVENAAAWIEDHRERPFFVWIHLSDPHEPYLVRDAPPDTELRLDGESVLRFAGAAKEIRGVELPLAPGAHTLEIRRIAPPEVPVVELNLTAYGLDSLELDGASERTLLIDPVVRMAVRNPSDEIQPLSLSLVGKHVAWKTQPVRRAYAEEVAFSDRQLGRLRTVLERLALDDRTLWVVASDHGEGLYHRGGLGHQAAVWEDQLRIAWLVKGSGIPAGVRIASTPVHNHDVLPTVLDVMKLPVGDGLSGVSRVGCWQGGSCESRGSWSALGIEHDARRATMVATYRWPFKFIQRAGRKPVAFNLQHDPGESVRLAPRELPDGLDPRSLRRQHDELLERLQGRLDSASDPAAREEAREMLESLGYLGDD